MFVFWHERSALPFLTGVDQAWYVSTTAIACVAPPTNASVVVHVSLSLNGQQFSSTTAPFLYLKVWEVTSVSPSAVSLSGNATVTVYGGTFRDTPDLACIFGGLYRSPAAFFVSETEIVCQTPTFDDLLLGTIEVTLNGQQSSNSRVPFEMFGGVSVDGFGRNEDRELGLTSASAPEESFAFPSRLVQKQAVRLDNNTVQIRELLPRNLNDFHPFPETLKKLTIRNVTKVFAGAVSFPVSSVFEEK